VKKLSKILILDDDQKLLQSLKENLSLKNYSVNTISNGNNIKSIINNNNYNCVLLDVKIPGIGGDKLLEMIQQEDPSLPVIMISGQSNINTAVLCIKKGAYDFIEKPIDPEKLFISIKNAIEKQQLENHYKTVSNELKSRFELVGDCSKMQELYKTIQTVADTNATVLIKGETGTGKELVARAIHDNSSRKGEPFISINCAAIPTELLESELFGHRKGSFTDARADRKGKFMEANNGTIFLDEIGDFDLSLQPKLLRTLQNSEIEIIGENFPQKINARIIAATNQDLDQLVSNGKFRKDLYYRLNVVEIEIPPLRERTDDIPLLIEHFLTRFNNKYNKQVLAVNQQAISLLMNYFWAGNVRELEHLIEKLVVFADEKIIKLEEVQKVIRFEDKLGLKEPEDPNKILSLKEASSKFERNYILNVLHLNKWKKSETADSLGIDRSNLFKKMRAYEIRK
jgi:DNA-binding NtrC family response regulator